MLQELGKLCLESFDELRREEAEIVLANDDEAGRRDIGESGFATGLLIPSELNAGEAGSRERRKRPPAATSGAVVAFKNSLLGNVWLP